MRSAWRLAVIGIGLAALCAAGSAPAWAQLVLMPPDATGDGDDAVDKDAVWEVIELKHIGAASVAQILGGNIVSLNADLMMLGRQGTPGRGGRSRSNGGWGNTGWGNGGWGNGGWGNSNGWGNSRWGDNGWGGNRWTQNGWGQGGYGGRTW